MKIQQPVFHMLFLTSLLLFLMIRIQSQQNRGIPIMNFDNFQPYLQLSSDTTYLLNFWATWCVPCRRELPSFEQIHKEFSGRAIKVILVSLDFPDQYESNLLPFLKKNSITASVIVLNDPNSNAWIDKVDSSWSGSIPATLIYNKDQRHFFEKELNYEQLKEILSEMSNP
jgi:thiol-disulfide isomerase/thioredoxin